MLSALQGRAFAPGPAAFHAAVLARRAHGQRALPRRLPRQPRAIPPDSQERAYFVLLERTVTGPLIDLTKRLLLPALPEIVAATPAAINPHADAAHADGFADVIARIIARMHETYERDQGEGPSQDDYERIGASTAKQNADQQRRAFKAAIGLDPFLNDAHLPEQLDAWAKTNADLITSLRTRYLDDVKRLVVQHVGNGARSESIAKEIEDRFITPSTRDPNGQKTFRGITYQARRIARDQVNKLNGNLTRSRQTALGITRYRWRTALDERVRVAHAEREGVIFAWDSPPPDGNPGQPILCRCYGEAVLEDVVGGLDT